MAAAAADEPWRQLSPPTATPSLSPGGDLQSLAANWRANLDANLISAVLITAAVRERLGGGTVVNIGSIAADKGAGAYGAAKAALTSWNIEQDVPGECNRIRAGRAQRLGWSRSPARVAGESTPRPRWQVPT